MEPAALQITDLFEQHSGKQVRHIRLLGSGMCNNAWLVTTLSGQQYIMKVAQNAPEDSEQNNLFTEASLLQQLLRNKPELRIPQVAFAAHSPMLYAYPYIPGEWMKKTWPGLTETGRQQVCADLAQFHAGLHGALTEATCRALGLAIHMEARLDPENEADLALVLSGKSLPASIRDFAALCAECLQATTPAATYAICHNDSHNENILLLGGRLAGVVDFGDADYGDIHREFVCYASDYPDHFESIVNRYETIAGCRLLRKRIIAFSFLEILDNLVEDFRQTNNFVPLHRFEQLWQQYNQEAY